MTINVHSTSGSEAAPQVGTLTHEELCAQLLEHIGRLRGALQKWHTAFARKMGTTAADTFRGQGRALALLADKGEMTQRDMCELLHIRPQSLGETLGKLERAGYISRHPSAKDRRALVVRITLKGRKLIGNSKPNLLFKTFTDDELRDFITYIDRALDEISDQAQDDELQER